LVTPQSQHVHKLHKNGLASSQSWSCFRSCGIGTTACGKWCFFLHM